MLFLIACVVMGTETAAVEDTTPYIPSCDEDGDGWMESDADCDSSDPMINPGAIEECDGVDNNCDGQIDEGLDATWYEDRDEDGIGSEVSVVSCDPGLGWSLLSGDCDDTDDTTFPDAVESCDGIDNDCDGAVDDGAILRWYEDADGDGYGSTTTFDGCDPGVGWCLTPGDCDDADATAVPGGTEVCDGIDNNCDGRVDEGC